MKIIHLANWNSTNIGNGALAYGAERVLREDIRGVEFSPEPWDDYTFELKHFDNNFVDHINRDCDIFLINGAVTFNGRHYMPNTGMRFDPPLSLWSKIKKPMVFYGVSYRYWGTKEAYHHRDKLRSVMEYIFSENNRIVFAVRNDGTKEWLTSLLDISGEKIYEIPDTGLFIEPARDKKYPELVDGRKNIMIGFNNEDTVRRFQGNNGRWKENKELFLKSLANVFEVLDNEYDVNFVLCPHYLDDYTMIGEFLKYLKPRIAHQRTVSTGLLKVKHAPYFYGRYAQADLALSMRVHSMSPSIGMGTPVVPLVSQGRLSVFLENAGLTGLSASVFDDNLSDALLTLCRSALDNPSTIRRQLSDSTQMMREQIKTFNRQIFLEKLKV